MLQHLASRASLNLPLACKRSCPSNSYDGLNTTTVHNLTGTMILHPIAAAFALFAAIFGFCGAGYSRIGTILMSLCAALATLVTLVIWLIDMSFWGVVRNRIRDNAPAGTFAQYGNANCESSFLLPTSCTFLIECSLGLTLGALLALLLGFCTAAFGACGNYSRRREKV